MLNTRLASDANTILSSLKMNDLLSQVFLCNTSMLKNTYFSNTINLN